MPDLVFGSSGTRTMIYQRVRLQSLADASDLRWARILWYDDPPACVVELEGRGATNAGSAAQATPLVRIPDPGGAEFVRVLRAALAVLLELRRTCQRLGKTLVVQGMPTHLGDLATLYGIEALLPRP